MSKIMLRIFISGIGISLLVCVIWLGFTASRNPNFVMWFGLASAILAPAGIAAISYSITAGKNEALTRLEKIPEIQKLIKEAKTQKEKIKLLEQQREELIIAVELEARKQALVSRRNSLQKDASNLIAEFESLTSELSALDSEIDNSKANEIVSASGERLEARKRGDIVLKIGERYITLNRDFVLSMPMGYLILGYFQLFETINNRRPKN